MGFLQQFHLIIKYKKEILNKFVDMISRPPKIAFIVIQQSSLVHASYVEWFNKDEYFKEKLWITKAWLSKWIIELSYQLQVVVSSW